MLTGLGRVGDRPRRAARRLVRLPALVDSPRSPSVIRTRPSVPRGCVRGTIRGSTVGQGRMHVRAGGRRPHLRRTAIAVSPGRLASVTRPPWALTIASHEGEAEPGPAGAGAGLVGADEPLEGVVEQLRREAGAVVVHHEPVACDAVTVTVVPGGVCLRALVSRLVTTWCRRCSSPAPRPARRAARGASCGPGRGRGRRRPPRAAAGSGRPGRRRSGRPESRRASRSRSSTSAVIRADSASTLSSAVARLAVGLAAGELGVARDRGQRRAQLVGGVGDELAHLLLAAVPRREATSRRGRAACSGRRRPGRPRCARR